MVLTPSSHPLAFSIQQVRGILGSPTSDGENGANTIVSPAQPTAPQVKPLPLARDLYPKNAPTLNNPRETR